ncbi:MAG: D-alanyl-D-alanine carboxypeptidase [Myxococcales bacterium]|nr:D-alanyl-D-alanine carboxypeptidase [Myxococcales bacterium]
MSRRKTMRPARGSGAARRRRAVRRHGLAAVLLTLTLAAPTHAAEPLYNELARAVVGAGQGVYVVAEDGTVLAAEAAARAVHPASVTKIATTLALLERLGPDHRFTTRVLAGGDTDGATLRGDLVVAAGGDPFFVDEGAAAILRRLHMLGLRQVTGRLIVRGMLLFDWQRDPEGRGLARALAGAIPSWPTAPDWPPLGAAALTFGGAAAPRPGSTPTPLVEYRSPPLLAIVKALNGYSNNVFHLAADAIGGAAAVEAAARAAVSPELRGEIVIANAAGAGTVNRISPRAAVALLEALQRRLAGFDRDLTAVLPVSGIDPGTLRERLLTPPAGRGLVVGKTGTYGSQGASGLAGALRTARYGVVSFAILNRGLPVPEARRRQDALVTGLAAALGAEPWPYAAPAAPAFDQAELR